MLINALLGSVKSPNYSLFWERYQGVYYPNSLLIISDSNLNLTMRYEIVTSNNVTVPITRSFINSTIQSTYLTIGRDDGDMEYPTRALGYKPTELISTRDTDILNSRIASKHQYEKTPVRIVGSKVRFDIDFPRIVCKDVQFEYLKNPTPINHHIDQMTELPILDEIINAAALRLKAYIKDDGYNLLLNEKQINE